MTKEKIKWHPAFAAAVQLELKDYEKHLEFFTEHQLTAEPLRIDILIIKKLDNIKIHKLIGKIFKQYNIFEYKSPSDYVSIDDYFKIKAYAYLYKALSSETNKIDIDDITLTITSNKYPKKLIQYLKSTQKAEIEKIDSGIYYIEKTDIKTQLLVTKDLPDEQAAYLKLLQTKYQNRELIKKWLMEYISNTKNPLYAIIMDVVTEANPNELLEVYKDMGVGKISSDNKEFLLEIMRKLELDKKLREEGRQKGKEEGSTEKALKVAKNLLEMGLDIKQVAIATELSIEQVKKIKNRVRRNPDN
ncbi:3-isopropylmalate dehydrogenase [Clostridium sp. DJ247]|uniref:3-isopropylmalate dehydrogenase n=1 Tax=Clostridium sp. DJ247 TaxID=2726188 RepID=UPI0016246871|nr:3-isopropylmalate dehydrogenase [Clostridium sp. DJ247]MBC2582945.1 3-isopropylmalate dehydrogenase [Clostridium sp. DJ247]